MAMSTSGNPAAAATVTPDSGPGGLPRGLVVLLGLAGAVVMIAGIRVFSTIAAPVLLALMLVVAVQPLGDRLQRKGAPRWLAVLVTLIALNLILIGMIAALVVSIAQLATLLPQYTDKANDLLADVQNWLAGMNIGAQQQNSMLQNFQWGKLVGVVEGLLTGLLGVLTNVFFLLALLIFMAMDASSFGDRMRAVAHSRPDIAYALSSFAHGTRSYLLVSTVFGLIVAVIDSAALWALGIPLPILWGLLSFITNYIPNIGFVIGLIPPALIALLEGGPSLMLWVIVLYSVINVIIQSVIQPKFVGDAVGLSVTLTFLALVFWGWVLGPLGALLAIPATLLGKALLVDIDPATRWANALIAGSAPTAAELAAAEDEAARQARELYVEAEDEVADAERDVPEGDVPEGDVPEGDDTERDDTERDGESGRDRDRDEPPTDPADRAPEDPSP